MNNLYEYDDILNSPIEAFYYKYPENTLPVKEHWHYFLETIYVISGEIKVSCNDTVHILKSGNVIFIPPQAVHSISNASDKNNYCYAVLKFDSGKLHISGNYIPGINTIFATPVISENLPLFFSEKDYGEFNLNKFFTDCIKEIKEKKYGYDVFIFNRINEFLIILLRLWRDYGLDRLDLICSKPGEHSIRNIIHYIDEHSSENLEVNELAKMCGMSYSHFAKTFRSLYKQTCKEYIEFVRLNKAENMLLFTNYDLNYISSETGFSDCSHFIRIFKRKYSITPKQYRLKQQKRK